MFGFVVVDRELRGALASLGSRVVVLIHLALCVAVLGCEVVDLPHLALFLQRRTLVQVSVPFGTVGAWRDHTFPCDVVEVRG